MKNGLNLMLIMGNLGRDPEVRFAQNGSAICTLSVAVGGSYKKDDEWFETTEWFRIKVFGRAAENCAQYLSKGSQVHVQGRGKHDKYTDKDGVEKRTFEVMANRVTFLDSKSGGERQENSDAPPHRERPASGGGSSAPKDDGFYDDDLPFISDAGIF